MEIQQAAVRVLTEGLINAMWNDPAARGRVSIGTRPHFFGYLDRGLVNLGARDDYRWLLAGCIPDCHKNLDGHPDGDYIVLFLHRGRFWQQAHNTSQSGRILVVPLGEHPQISDILVSIIPNKQATWIQPH